MKPKDLITTGVITLVLVAGVMAVILLTGDSDLFLWAADLFGKSPGSLAGQVVWITGASSGIGEELAYVLAASGCKLVLSARRRNELERVGQHCMDEYKMRSEDVLILPLDLLQFDTHKSAVDIVLTHFKKIDILVNNAGRSQRALWVNTSFEVDREILEVNTLGPLSLTKAVLPHMVERKSGHIAVVSSVVGLMGAPGLGSYAGSKHALHGWFDTLRMEVFEDNIHISMLCPGPIFSNALKFAFTGKSGEALGVDMEPGERRMTTERCAHLCAVAIANQLDEAWISLQPELSYYYLNQYMPAVARWAAVRIAGPRLQKLKEGRNDLHAS
ncbi:dehydrogenase/reductase SDR family member 7-like [Littorina saxatilis]|uniref:Dehydrogenase/reductase SDR family member 7 n=1 Tax=Littorina saxatilis TaxID=31220 RepID=A0AAN9BMA6_9CAEN